MAGKQHGLRRPARIGLLNDKGILAILAKSSAQDTPIRRAEVVAALGPGWTRVKDPCNGETYVVSNTTGAQYAPGSMVFLASNQGNPGETIIAGHPPTNRGALGFVLNPRSEVLPIPISEPVHTHIAFFNGSVVATYYDGSDAGETYGSAAEADPIVHPTFLRSDIFETVGPYCLNYWDGVNRISVFDPNSETVHTYTPDSEYHLLAVLGIASNIYWVEMESEQHGGVGTYATYFRLRRSSLNMSNVVTLDTVDFPNSFPAVGPGFNHFIVWPEPGAENAVARFNFSGLSGGVVIDLAITDGEESSGIVRVETSLAEIAAISNDPVDPLPESDFQVEAPVTVNDHPTYGTPVLGGAYPLDVV